MNNIDLKNKKLFRITNELENHRGFQYKTGLNIDTNNFDNKNFAGNGLFFGDNTNIIFFIWYGINIREVTLPDDANVIFDQNLNQYKTDKFILSDKRSLKDVQTWNWMHSENVNFYGANNDALLWAITHDLIDIIKFLISINVIIDPYAVCSALLNQKQETINLLLNNSKLNKLFEENLNNIQKAKIIAQKYKLTDVCNYIEKIH